MFGVLNVTPDSFSDGGRFSAIEAAVAHGKRMWSEGAQVIDVGGESTRPGAARVGPAEERDRIVPVIRELASCGVTMSVDTTRSEVAARALDAGASMVNDVSGGLADPAMARLVAETRCPWVIMHWRGHSRTMATLAQYGDVVHDVRVELAQRVDAAVAAGVSPDQIVLDPGIGFSKRTEHNWRLSARLEELISLGYPVLFGASRKSYLGEILADDEGRPRPVDQRDAATIATTLLAIESGVWGVRVHDVRANVDAIKVWRAIQGARA